MLECSHLDFNLYFVIYGRKKEKEGAFCDIKSISLPSHL